MKHTALLLIIFMPIFVSAQIFGGGVLAGVCGSQVDGDEQSGFNRPGLLAGVYVNARTGKRTALQTEMYYAGKGAVLNEKYADGTSVQIFKSDLKYIEMPLYFTFMISDKFTAGFGASASYLISAQILSYGYPVDPDTYTMNNFDFAPSGFADFYLTDRLSISVKYSHSSFSVRADDQWFNNNLSILLKYKIK